MPSSRQPLDNRYEEHPFRPKLSKKSRELAKVRSNLNFTVFENLYCRRPKCNHVYDSRDKPQRHSQKTRSKKSSGRAPRE